MLLRGKLLFPLYVAIARLDTQATDAGGTGYNPITKQPKVVYANPGTSAQVRTDTRVYMEPLILRAQIERSTWQAMQMGPGGNVPNSRLTLIFHMTQLEQLGLVDAVTGEPTLKVTDKLIGIYSSCGKAATHLKQVADIRDAPGCYCTEVSAAGEGLAGNRNLLKMVFDDRPHGVTR